MIDELAHELGMDPIEFRMKNLMRSGDAWCRDSRWRP